MSRRSILLTALVMCAVAASPARADDTIHPGDFIRFDSIPNNIWCTAAFVFDGVGAQTGKVFMATAAHCIQKPGGQEVTVGSGPDNGATDVAGFTGGTEVLGRIVAQGKNTTVDSDWALIEVRPEMAGRIRPELRQYPQHPTGVATPADMQTYDLLEHVGYGIPFFVNPALRDQRQGLYLSSDGKSFQSLLAVYGGDSGGPIVHAASGKAVGILNGYKCSTLPETSCVVQGATVAEAIAQAALQGFTVRLRRAGESALVAPPPPPGGAASPAPPASAGSSGASSAAPRRADAPQQRAAAHRKARSCTSRAKQLRGSRRARALKRCRAKHLR